MIGLTAMLVAPLARAVDKDLSFHVGDTWQGGTFTSIENDHFMRVRDDDGALVGRFPMGFLNGDQATIQFNRFIKIVAILWYDNDPNPGEAGWSFNGIAGPLTGVIAGLRARMTPRVVRWLNIVSAALIGGFGVVAILIGIAG